MSGVIPSAEFNDQLQQTVREMLRRSRGDRQNTSRWNKKGLPVVRFILAEDLLMPECVEHPTWADAIIIRTDPDDPSNLNRPRKRLRSSRTEKIIREDDTGFDWQTGAYGIAIKVQGEYLAIWCSCGPADFDCSGSDSWS